MLATFSHGYSLVRSGGFINGSLERVADFRHSGQDLTKASMSFDTPDHHTKFLTPVRGI